MAGNDNGGKESAWEKAETTFVGKRNSEYFDPCQEAASRSMRCLRRNGGDRDMCADYFQAYRDCKKQWTEKNPSEGKASRYFDGP